MLRLRFRQSGDEGAKVRPNQLHYGDNLDVLREYVRDSSVDLVYLDPPFNSNRTYNVLFTHEGHDDSAQMHAFDDTWHWTRATEEQYDDYINGGLPITVADALGAFRMLIGESDMMAYLVNIAPRLVELHRVLKPTGSLYLHCDPAASHYLKVMLDAIFGSENFRNEIIWKRTSGHSDAARFGNVHDVLLFYAKSRSTTFNRVYQAYDAAYVEQYYRYQDPDGRRFMSGDLSAAGLAGGGYTYEWKGVTRKWRAPIETMRRLDAEGRIFYTRNGMPRMKRYLDEAQGLPGQDLWTDIEALRSWHAEKLGYPTQKPVALLERILEASTNEGDVVLDPFCGCGTTIDAAIRMQRRWIGIDVTFIAVDLIRTRLVDRFGEGIADTYSVTGIPRDLPGAHALFDQSPFEFERWAVSLVQGTANEKQVGDKGFDGLIRFHHSGGKGPSDGKILVSVKGGRQLNPSMVQALDGALNTHKAQMGVLITLNRPTAGMRKIADMAGSYTWPLNGERFPRLQVLTVEDLLAGARLQAPPRDLPYLRAARHIRRPDQVAIEM